MLHLEILENKVRKEILVFFLMAILVLYLPSSVQTVMADPPVPEGPQTIFPKVFCLRIMDIREVNTNTFDIEFEILNWSNVPVHTVEFNIASPNMGNVVFDSHRIDPDGRPLLYDVDVDNDGNFPPADLGDFEDTNNNGIVDPGEDINGNNRFDNDEAPGNLPTPNDWIAGAFNPTQAVFNAGTPIPNIDLLNSATTAIANAKLPNWPVPIDANGILANFEDIDNGVNVLDGFVLRVTDLDDFETFTMNWYLYDVNNNVIGTPQSGNAMGFGMITLSYLENAGPNPTSPFVGLPSLATDPRDFYGQVYNTNSILFAGVIPAALAYSNLFPIGGNFPAGTTAAWLFTEVVLRFLGGDGSLIIFNANPIDDPFFHWLAVFQLAFVISLGILRASAPGDGGSMFDLNPGQTAPMQGTNQAVPPPGPFVATTVVAAIDPNYQIALSGSNVGGGPLGTDSTFNILVDQNGDGTGTALYSGGGIPPPDTNVDVNFEVRNRTIPADFDFVPNPGPDTLRDGQILRFGFSDVMNTSFLPTNLNVDIEIIDLTLAGAPVPIADGSVIPSWSDNQHLDLELTNIAGTTITEPLGKYAFQMKPGATLLDAKGDVISLNFRSGAATGSLGGPANLCTINPSGVTTLLENCEVRGTQNAGGSVTVGGSGTTLIVTPGSSLGIDFHLQSLQILAGNTVIVQQTGQIVDIDPLP